MRAFCRETFFEKKVSPRPFQKASIREVFGISILGELVRRRGVSLTEFVSVCIVFSTRTAGSLGSRKRLGTAEPLSAQKVVLFDVGISVAFPLGGSLTKNCARVRKRRTNL